MKTVLFVIFLTFIKIIGQVDTRIDKIPVTLPEQYKSVRYSTILQADLAVDSEGNLIIAPRFEYNIIQYSYTNEVLKIPVPVHNEKEKMLYNVKLAVSEKDEKYAVILNGEFFRALYKLDFDNKKLIEINLGNKAPRFRVTRFYIINNKLYLNTFPSDMLNLVYQEKGGLFIYDLKGNFIKQCFWGSYELEDNLRFQAISKNFDVQLKIFNDNGKGDEFNPQNSVPIKAITIECPPDMAYWQYLGKDRKNNFYVGNSKVIKIYNNNLEYIAEINPGEFLENNNILTINTRKIRVSPNGEIIILGVRGLNKQITKVGLYSKNEIELVKITFTLKKS